jgi:hypothetical protein
MSTPQYVVHASNHDQTSSKHLTFLSPQEYQTVKDAVLFAIDISPSMLAPPDVQNFVHRDKDSAALAALKCAYQLMQQRIITNPNDMMGILLFGTKESKVPDHRGDHVDRFPHCYLLTDLDVPAATDVKRLRDLVNDADEAARLLAPSLEQVNMANVMFCANQIFTTKAPNFTSKRLFLVTDNDNPHANDKELRSSAAVRAKDLYDLGVVIELFPIAQPDQTFDRAKFYDVWPAQPFPRPTRKTLTLYFFQNRIWYTMVKLWTLTPQPPSQTSQRLRAPETASRFCNPSSPR